MIRAIIRFLSRFLERIESQICYEGMIILYYYIAPMVPLYLNGKECNIQAVPEEDMNFLQKAIKQGSIHPTMLVDVTLKETGEIVRTTLDKIEIKEKES